MDFERVDVLQEEPEVGRLDHDVLLDQLGSARASRLNLHDVHADRDLDWFEVVDLVVFGCCVKCAKCQQLTECGQRGVVGVWTVSTTSA